MEKIYQGKTKDVYLNNNGNYTLKFKDDVTGENGVFDPGANTVGLSIEGIGNKGLRLTEYFYTRLNEQGIKTHFVSVDLENNTMEVLPATVFGKGLEVVCRLKATGSFIKRYGDYISEGKDTNYFVEVTLKDDERQDPPISKDALALVGLLSNEEYEILKEKTQIITKMIEAELAKFEIVLYDIKLEFGRSKKDNEIILIDEISGGNMRAYHNNELLTPMDLAEIVLSKK